MQNIGMSSKLNSVCYEIRGPVLKHAKRMEEEGHKILKLNIGNPAPFGFDAPDEILVDVIRNLPTSQGYCDSKGIYSARKAVVQHYQKKGLRNLDVEDVYIGNGASELIVMSMQALLNNGDEILVPAPDYPLWTASVALSGGKAVHYMCDEENDWYPNLDDMVAKITPKTRGIVLINPNNPTGALMDEAFLKQIVDIARACDAYLLCDEVYRGTDASGDGFTASIADLYEKGISTASMSKSFSLAGLRLGWIAAPTDVIHAVTIHRDYNTISVGMLDDHFACIALECKEQILERSRSICQANREVLDAWISNEPLISYVKPQSGTVALLKYDLDMSSREFCVRLLESKGVMFTPGSVLEMEGYVRIGYANNSQVLKDGLQKTSEFLAELNG